MTRPVPTPPRVCEHCGQTFARSPRKNRRGGLEAIADYMQRKFCSVACKVEASRRSGNPNATRATKERARARRAAALEDLEWIIGTDSPENIAHRLGYSSLSNLERVLHRWGRLDLAARLKAVDAA